MFDRSATEEHESQWLAPHAMRNDASRGRRHEEEEHPYRTAFMRDRDRIIHSAAFRRLEYKTQVFVYHEGDHYRTRLTHTIEVAQIARTIARALRLNEDLCEAIALSHDIGHPPFGHSGERALGDLVADEGGFEHNIHALRIVDHVENRYPDFRGLNLTWETREAIAKHSKRPHDPSFDEFQAFKYPCLEAQVADIADSIAYNSHDLDDGLTSGLLAFETLGDVSLWRRIGQDVMARGGLPNKLATFQIIRRIINAQVGDVIRQTENNVRRFALATPDDIRNNDQPTAAFSGDMRREHKELKVFLRQNMYKSYRVIRMEEKAYRVIRRLFEAYDARPELLPPNVAAKLETEGKKRLICDYLAGMTDKYALEEYQKLFDPMARV
jgi:dGTPase